MDTRNDALSKLYPDEPFFLIRARDIYSMAAIQAYASISQRHTECHKIIVEFKKWQQENPARLRKPD